jgi:hypothetical protein
MFGHVSDAFVPFHIVKNSLKGSRLVVALLVALSIAACTFVSAYDQDSVDRTSAISKSVLTFYQDLLAIDLDERKAAVTGEMAKRAGEIETQIRLHLLREQGRHKNDEGIEVASNLLKSWQTFSESHRQGDATSLTDATLNVERTILERHLRSAFVAEEARKLVSGKR